MSPASEYHNGAMPAATLSCADPSSGIAERASRPAAMT